MHPVGLLRPIAPPLPWVESTTVGIGDVMRESFAVGTGINPAFSNAAHATTLAEHASPTGRRHLGDPGGHGAAVGSRLREPHGRHRKKLSDVGSATGRSTSALRLESGRRGPALEPVTVDVTLSPGG